MFCKKCGKELTDGASFCPGCGAKIASSAGETANDPVISLNTQGKTEKKKKKWLIPTLVSTAVLAVVAVVAYFWLFPGIGDDLGKAKKSPEEILLEQNQTALKNNMDELSDLFQNFYTPKDGSQKGKVHIKLNEDVLDLFGVMEQYGWLSDVKLSYDITEKNYLSDVNMKLDIDGAYIASFELLANKRKGDAYVILPDFNKTPVFVDINAIPDVPAVVYDMLAYFEDLEKPVLKSSEMLLNSFSTVTEVTETLTIDEVSQELIIIKASMTQQELVEAELEILEAMRENSDFMSVFNKVIDSYETAGQAYDAEKLLDNFKTILEDQLKDKDFDADEKICLNTYLDASDNLVGHDLTVGDKTVFSYITLTAEKKTAVKYRIGESIEIVGNGEKSGKKFTGTMVLSLDDKEYAEMELKNFAYEDGSASGSIRVIPMDRMLNAIYEMLGLDENMTESLKRFSVVADIQFKNENSTSISVTAVGGLEIATIEITSEKQDVSDVILPENFVDKSNDTQMLQWTKEMSVQEKLQNIQDRLLNVGMPGDIWKDVETLIKTGLTYVALPS